MRLSVLFLAACTTAMANVPLAENSRLGPLSLARHSHQGIGPAKALHATGIAGCLCDERRRSRSTGAYRDGAAGEVPVDFMGARSLQRGQGRWTSPDEPLADQHPADPQSWNLYAYAGNNPLQYVDPTGAYICSVSITTQQCDSFEQGRLDAQSAADKLKDKYGQSSRQYSAAQRGVDALGRRGVDNGVTVAVAALKGAGGEVEAGQNGVRLTINSATLKEGGSALAATIAHEGSHTADAQDWIKSGFKDVQHTRSFDTEFRAYQISLDIMGTYQIPPVGWGGVLVAPGFPDSINDPQIEKMLARPPYGVTRKRQGVGFNSADRVNRK